MQNTTMGSFSMLDDSDPPDIGASNTRKDLPDISSHCPLIENPLIMPWSDTEVYIL